MIALFACAPVDPVPLERASAPDPAPVLFPEPSLAVDLDPAPDVVHVQLTAAPRVYQVGGRFVEGYAYNGENPGPTIRARAGDTLVVDLTNALDADTTLHWHGLKVPYAMDGVTWQADPVRPGETFTYTFPLSQTGTFWYHPHFDSAAQVDLGLYGLLVVEDPDDPPVDREIAVLLDDWTESDEGVDLDRHGLQSFPGEWSINGVFAPTLELRGGESVRARVLNASNTRYLALQDVRLLAADQGLLPAPIDAAEWVLAPGDRAELEWLVGQDPPALVTLPYSANGGPAFGDPVELATITVAAPSAPPASPAWPVDARPPTLDPGTTDIVYVLTGDDDQWLINGERFPDVTIEALTQGQVAVIEVRNLSPAEHPFHLHGLTFEVLSVDGSPPAYAQIEDTINVRIRQTVRLLVSADNPGDWMAHCHLLPHAHEGMMTVLRVW